MYNVRNRWKLKFSVKCEKGKLWRSCPQPSASPQSSPQLFDRIFYYDQRTILEK